MEAVKPHLYSVGLLLTITDAVIYESGRFYVKATATLTDGQDSIFAEALAREEETKKGQDAAQITGSASSYARKYALNGLFCIDDTKDPDATNTHGQEVVRVSGKELMGQAPAQSVKDVFAACTDRPTLVKAWNKYKGTTQEGEAKEALRVRKQELNIE